METPDRVDSGDRGRSSSRSRLAADESASSGSPRVLLNVTNHSFRSPSAFHSHLALIGREYESSNSEQGDVIVFTNLCT